MRKFKLYLDTSVISHLFAEDTLEKMADTNNFWQELKQGKFDISISVTTLGEIDECDEPKRSKMLSKLNEVEHEVLTSTKEVEHLAREYVKNNILSEKHFDDCTHIAYAVINGCDIIVSWNFRHLVNHKTINGVKIVNAINNYKEISIMSPSMLSY